MIPRLCFAATLVGGWLAGARPASAQDRYLQPGDVAVTCVDTTGTAPATDRIQVTALVDLPVVGEARYQIWYTDLEADVDGMFYDFDENYSEIPLGGAKHAGEPTMYPASGLAGPDEQVFLFQGFLDDQSGRLSTGLLLWGFQVSSAGGWATARTGEVSELPRSLQTANVALKSNGGLIFAYAGPTTGTRAELQAAIGDPLNWTAGAACPTGFTITEPIDGGGGDGDAGDAATDPAPVDTAASDAGDAARVVDSTGLGGSTGTGGRGDGGSGAPDPSGLGGVTGAGGITGTGGIAGSSGMAEREGSDAGSDLDSGEGNGDGKHAAGGNSGADVAVDANTLTLDGGGRDAGGDTAHPPSTKSGCGCAVADGLRGVWSGAGWLLALVVWLRRRPRSTGRSLGTRAGPDA